MQAARVRARASEPAAPPTDLLSEEWKRRERKEGPRRGEQHVLLAPLALLLENPSQMFSLFMT